MEMVYDPDSGTRDCEDPVDISLNSSIEGELTTPYGAHYYSLTLTDDVANLTISLCDAANFDTQLAHADCFERILFFLLIHYQII